MEALTILLRNKETRVPSSEIRISLNKALGVCKIQVFRNSWKSEFCVLPTAYCYDYDPRGITKARGLLRHRSGMVFGSVGDRFQVIWWVRRGLLAWCWSRVCACFGMVWVWFRYGFICFGALHFNMSC